MLFKLLSLVPSQYRDTVYLRLFSFFKIPLIHYIRPSVIALNDEHCIVKIKPLRRNKNHLNSIYFGVLAIAAEATGGLIAIKTIHASGKKIAFVFKHFEADFFKRVEGDAFFTCNDIDKLKSLIDRAIASGEREELDFTVTTTCPQFFGEEPVAQFKLTASVKLVSK